MKAFLSSEAGADRIIFTRAGLDGPQMARAEARAILAETEPDTYVTHCGDAWHTPATYRMTDQQPCPAFVSLAASLAAILPVLDELEAEAGK